MNKTMKRNCRGCWFISLIASLLMLSACSSKEVKLLHPQNGATATCKASAYGLTIIGVTGVVDDCTREYEQKGYVRLEDLTPEHRADLEKRGLLPRR
jgi:hypothetical protein